MSIWEELKKIKSKSSIMALQSRLEIQHRVAAGPKSASVEMAHDFAGSNFKIGGIAYYRELCLSHANAIVGCASTKSHYIPPTPETMEWGGFLGGTNCVWTDADAHEFATNMVVEQIRAA